MEDNAAYRNSFLFTGLTLAVLVYFVPAVFAQDPAAKPGKAVVYLFSGSGCPHCAEEKEFLNSLQRKYPTLEIREYEVWYDRENRALFAKVIKAADVPAAGVPTTVIGKKVFVGFSPETRQSLEEAVSFCLQQGCSDSLTLAGSGGKFGQEQKQKSFKLPFFGETDPEKLSLPLLTLIIGGLDSFNPCAFFVLLFLLSMLIHGRSRKKMLFIGAVFVFFSGLIYFLFMAAWLNIFLVAGQLKAITVTAGIVAVLISSVNIKDFFFFKKGLSLVIPERAKPKLFERMRHLLSSSSVPAMLGGTIVLAVSANAYELLCTAGFPMVYTRALTLHSLSRAGYYLYLVFYNIVYVVPLAVIVFVLTISLGSRKMTEWQGRKLKLVSGLMMLFLGLILLVNPALLNNAAASAAVLIGVLMVAWITITAMKRVKPEMTGARGK